MSPLAFLPTQTLKRQDEIQKELEGVGEDMDAMSKVRRLVVGVCIMQHCVQHAVRWLC